MKIEDLKVIIKEAMGEDTVLLEQPDQLVEANLNRAKQKIEIDHVPFAMFTAFRGDYSKEENEGRNAEIKDDPQTRRFAVGGHARQRI